MSSQIFKSKPEISLFKELLNNICDKNDSVYILNNASFKKGIMFETIQKFCEEIGDCYYDSKKFYIERKMTYKYFITVVRQVCKIHDLTYQTETKYNKSTYEIFYMIDVFD
jgi:hypothetical protein